MPAAERHNHLARMSEAPKEEPDKDAPLVTPALVEYLEQQFKHPAARGMCAVTQDGVIHLASALAEYAGQCAVIDHLKSLIRT